MGALSVERKTEKIAGRIQHAMAFKMKFRLRGSDDIVLYLQAFCGLLQNLVH